MPFSDAPTYVLRFVWRRVWERVGWSMLGKEGLCCYVSERLEIYKHVEPGFAKTYEYHLVKHLGRRGKQWNQFVNDLEPIGWLDGSVQVFPRIHNDTNNDDNDESS